MKKQHGIAWVVALAALGVAAGPAWAQTSTAPARKTPIVIENSPAATLLNTWGAAGTAAGLAGVAYDNRDRKHSYMPTDPFPQLQVITYSEAETKANRDWAMAPGVRQGIVFGNSSTAAPATLTGSNPRSATIAGLGLLYAQYRGNNLYMYPAHHDYHPGHNGLANAFHGDLFPTNTPFVITSVGSSGTDQPFMKAVALTLAAFRPEVREKLKESGLLMPTLQMIFRQSNKQVQKPVDYLTGAAHPTAFEGSQVDAVKMVQMAHEITLDKIPPFAALHLRQADELAVGRECFDPLPETLGATPAVIARIYRSTAPARHLVVSAEASMDVNQRPLTYHWALLRGDPFQVTINPANKSGSVVEITIPYHPRAPIAPGAALESNRVDIACFVYNGAYFSAPAFVTDLTLDNEARTYDAQGRILEVGYNMGESVLVVAKWNELLAALAAPEPAPAVRMLISDPTPATWVPVREIAMRYAGLGEAWARLEKARVDAEAAVQTAAPENKKTLEEAAKKARTAVEDLGKVRETLVTTVQPGLTASLKNMLEGRLKALLASPTFYPDHATALGIKKLPPGAETQLRTLRLYGVVAGVAAGVAAETPGQALPLIPLLSGDKPVAERLSAYQRALVARFNAEILASLVPGLRHDYRPNTVDFRLTLPKNWRDVYRYAADGTPLGFTRYDGVTATEFSAGAEIVVQRDKLNRPLVTQAPKYERKTPPAYDPRRGPDTTPLTFSPGVRYRYWAYENDADLVGHVEKTEINPPATATAPGR